MIKFKPLIDTLKVGKISDQEYFSSKYSTYISNSRLGSLNPKQEGDPEKFFHGIDKIYSESLILGSAVHTKILQPNLFNLISVRRPTAKLGFVCDYIYQHSKDKEITDELIEEASNEIDYYKGKLTPKIKLNVYDSYQAYKEDLQSIIEIPEIENMYLSPSVYEKANLCIDACNKNKEFQRLLHPENAISENELAFTIDILCDYPDRTPIILKLKAKLDNFTIDIENNEIVVNDLKTLGSVLTGFDGPEGNFQKYHYYRELAIYLWLLKMYVSKEYKMENPRMKVNCLVVSTIPTYETKVYKVTNEEIKQGTEEFRTLMKMVAYYRGYQGYDFRRM